MSGSSNPFFENYREKLKLGNYRLKLVGVPDEVQLARGLFNGQPTDRQKGLNPSTLRADFFAVNPLTQGTPPQKAPSTFQRMQNDTILRNLGKTLNSLRMQEFLNGLSDIENSRKNTNGASDNPPGTHQISSPKFPIPSF